MERLTNKQLTKYLVRKGITLDQSDILTFRSNDYFQLINAYKYLFVDYVETIDDILNYIKEDNKEKIDEYVIYFSISKYVDNDDLSLQILNKIVKKYGIDIAKGSSVNAETLKKRIEMIHFKKHCFASGTNYKDFVRMFHLEHELRSILMERTLYIEERIKKVFIKTLNDFQKIETNFLANIENYDMSGNNKNSAIRSLGKVIDMHNNPNSKPIKHKMDQELTVPYWILINEMTMGQTLSTINNLKDEYRLRIGQELVNEMSKRRINIFDKSKSKTVINSEIKTIKSFISILNYLGEFRNIIAHNQPLYCYNVKNNEGIITYSKPKANNKSPIDPTVQQYTINAQLQTELVLLFGLDDFNRRLSGVNIDLSWIIYVTKKITDVVMPKNDMGDRVRDIYKKYNLFLSYEPFDYINGNMIYELINGIKKMSSDDIQHNIEKGNYNKVIKHYKKIETKVELINNKNIKSSKYNDFSASAKYTAFTNIDRVYLIKYI